MDKQVRGKINGLIRLAFVGLLMLGQVALILFFTTWLQQESSIIYFFMEILGLVVVLALISSGINASYKVAWIIIILMLPVFGVWIYIVWGRGSIGRDDRQRFYDAEAQLKPFVHQDMGVEDAFEQQCPEYVRISHYLQQSGYPLYHGAKRVEFYPRGEEFFPKLYEELRSAKKYIFLEFFIIAEGEIWNQLKSILIEKVREGVEVRILYDDVGSLTTLEAGFEQEMKKHGIEARKFNPVNHYIYEFYLNYRNHQKIIVIDGERALTGGINLADEYANLYEKHGYWKDTFMLIEGRPAQSFLGIFLKMWDVACRKISDDYQDYFSTIEMAESNVKGYFQPFADGPVNSILNPVEDSYKQMIGAAREYCYITSPYLVLDDELVSILTRTARSGVDVRIVVPRIHDHWYTKIATQAFFQRLLEGGVQIYEFTPGFVHAKMVVCDDRTAIVGSINLDFRSMFLHYEDGIWMCDTPMVGRIKDDILETFAQSQPVDLEEWRKRPWWQKFIQLLFGIFAPVL